MSLQFRQIKRDLELGDCSWVIFGDFDSCPYTQRADSLVHKLTKGDERRVRRVHVMATRTDQPEYMRMCRAHNHSPGRVPLVMVHKDGRDQYVGGYTDLARSFASTLIS